MSLDWRSKLIQPDMRAPEGFRSLATPTYRGSTTLLRSAGDVNDHWDSKEQPYRYGLYGTPTTLELGARIAELEGASYSFITPGGQAAISLISLTFATTGSHVLIPESVYGPNRELAERLLSRFGVQVEFYDPLVGARIEQLFRPSTRLIWCESPGSITMEIQDIPAITAAARQHGIVTALDNTYAAGVHFDAFAHGVDVSMQALTKYIGGHSDLLLGSVSVRNQGLYERLGDAHQLLGMNASPDDCSLALRGLQTLAVRLAHLESSTLAVARWFEACAEIESVLHPAFPQCPGNALWKRDFTGSSSVFSVVFKDVVSREAIIRFIDSLEMFRLGFSWGGVTSLIMRYEQLLNRSGRWPAERIVRINVGLELVSDLLADLGKGLAALRA
jgi:cystathionine beta-lyase